MTAGYDIISLVACNGPPAARSCEPRQARKGAAVAIYAGAGTGMLQATTGFFRACPGVVGRNFQDDIRKPRERNSDHTRAPLNAT